MDFTDAGSNGQHSSWLTSIWETLIGRPQELPDTVVSKPALPRDTVTVASTSPTDSIASVLPAEITTSMAKLDTIVTPENLVLPPELLLRCFSYMSLKCLISSRCVCSDWRRLVPQSDLHPTRRRFLELYDKMLVNPLFLQSRTWTVDNLKPFDRQAYIATLNEQCNTPEAEIPEDFRMYILEWPARMAIGCMWPGFPFIESRTRNIQRQYGVNYLGYPPQLSALVFKHQLPEACFIPGLLIWRTPESTDWLLFDKTHDQPKSSIHGLVFSINLYPNPPVMTLTNDASIIPYVYDEKTDSDLYDDMFEGQQ